MLQRVLLWLTPVSPTLRAPLAIALGAIAGALSRYYLSLWLTQRLGTAFPYGTFIVNLSGSFALGFLTLVLTKIRPLPMELVWLIAIGGLGSYTTFATYELDSYRLFLDRRWWMLIAYWLGSPLLGLLGLYAGTVAARWFR